MRGPRTYVVSLNRGKSSWPDSAERGVGVQEHIDTRVGIKLTGICHAVKTPVDLDTEPHPTHAQRPTSVYPVTPEISLVQSYLRVFEMMRTAALRT